MNAPDRYERFVVPDGMQKVSYERDMKIMNAATFSIQREDHTIGNILRMQLHRDPNVLFAGYKLPHPLDYKIIVKLKHGYKFNNWVQACESAVFENGYVFLRVLIQTTSQSSPMQAYNLAINDLDKEFDHLKADVKAELDRLESERSEKYY